VSLDPTPSSAVLSPPALQICTAPAVSTSMIVHCAWEDQNRSAWLCQDSHNQKEPPKAGAPYRLYAAIQKALPESRVPCTRTRWDNSLPGLSSSTTQVQAGVEGPASHQCRVRGQSRAGTHRRIFPHKNKDKSGGRAQTCGVGRNDDGPSRHCGTHHASLCGSPHVAPCAQSVRRHRLYSPQVAPRQARIS
jgi:hypothetical protein